MMYATSTNAYHFLFYCIIMKNILPVGEDGFVELDPSFGEELELKAQGISPPDMHVLKSGSGVPCMMSHVFWLILVSILQVFEGRS